MGRLTRDEARRTALSHPEAVLAVGVLGKKIHPAIIEIIACSQDPGLIRLDQIGNNCAFGLNIRSGSLCTLAHGVVHETATSNFSTS
jgi:hypothetical protein